MRVLGVDPGAAGALALYDIELNAVIVADMPSVRVKGRVQVNEALLAWTLAQWTPDTAWIERVHAMPKQGVTSSFSFGVAFGQVRGVLAGLNVPYSLVTPNEWKRHFRLGPDKNEARLIAARLLPNSAASFQRVRDDGRAEAALLALFGAHQQKELCVEITS
jgi:crossover junction endodeoxyribonuclease RuvC